MERIDIDRISEQIAELEAYDEAVVRLFLQNLLSQIRQEIEAGNEVNLEGLGLFSLVEKGGDKFSNLQFEEEYKEEVNAPFSLFEPIELVAASVKESSQELERKTIEQINEESIEESTPLDADVIEQTIPLVLLETPLEGEEKVKEVSDEASEVSSQEELQAEDSEDKQHPEEAPSVVMAESVDATVEDGAEQEEEEILDQTEESEVTKVEQTEQVEAIPVVASVETDSSYRHIPTHDEDAIIHLRRRKKNVQMNWISIVVFIFIVGVLVYYAPKYISDFRSPDQQTQPALIEQVEATVVASTDTLDETTKTEEVVEEVKAPIPATTVTTPVVKKQEVKKEVKPAVVLEEEVKMLPRPRSVVLKKGERLALLARRYYGSMFFWVYIYDYNKAVYPNPDLIPLGAKLLLPSPSEYGINKDDPKSIERAKAKIKTLKK